MHDLIPLADADTGALISYSAEHDALRAFAENESGADQSRGEPSLGCETTVMPWIAAGWITAPPPPARWAASRPRG